MKVTLTDLLPDNTERTVTVENLAAETFDDAVALFRGAALALGFASVTVGGLKTRTDEDEAVQAIRDAIEATRARQEMQREREQANQGFLKRLLRKK